MIEVPEPYPTIEPEFWAATEVAEEFASMPSPMDIVGRGVARL